jgi:hypothetical protein
MRHNRAMRFFRREGAWITLALGVLASACSLGPTWPPLSPNLIAAFNDLYRQQHPITLMGASRLPVAPVVSEASATTTALRSCNDGTNPTVVGIGLVKVTGAHHVLWAAFVNPPGSHRGPNGGGGAFTANWYVVLIDAQAHEQHPWSCAAGNYSRLQALSIHN